MRRDTNGMLPGKSFYREIDRNSSLQSADTDQAEVFPVTVVVYCVMLQSCLPKGSQLCMCA